MDSIKDVVRSSVKVPVFDKHLKKAGGHIGRNVVEIIKIKTMVRKPLMIKMTNTLNANFGRNHDFLLHFLYCKMYTFHLKSVIFVV